jgi:2-dehydro-3-deoxyphosphooctonate aldolase (KDO 8-P synthase)
MRLFAGPCSLESEEICFGVASTIRDCVPDSVDYYFKTSFAKENRSSSNSFMGHGLDYAKQAFTNLRKDGFKIITDVHETWQVDEIAPYVDALQIPAFLCRQTPLLRAAANSGLLLNVKKGQFLAPNDTKNIADKLKEFGCKDFYLCERGTSFGYNNLVVDFRSIPIMKQHSKVCFDATHSTQLPGGCGDTTAGERQYVEPLAKSAMMWGADALFMEVHPNPSEALSDKECQIPLDEFPAMLSRILKVVPCIN